MARTEASIYSYSHQVGVEEMKKAKTCERSTTLRGFCVQESSPREGERECERPAILTLPTPPLRRLVVDHGNYYTQNKVCTQFDCHNAPSGILYLNPQADLQHIDAILLTW